MTERFDASTIVFTLNLLEALPTCSEQMIGRLVISTNGSSFYGRPTRFRHSGCPIDLSSDRSWFPL
jgi:hypothetical protein